MTKNLLKIVLLSTLAALLFATSCNKREPLSKLRQKEREAIANYIKTAQINVINALPEDSLMTNPKDYYLEPLSGLYINISNQGDGIPPKKGDNVRVYYYMMSMAGDTLINAWYDASSNIDEFTYNPGVITSTIVPAFSVAVGYFGHLGEAELIVPSQIGITDAQTNITPYRFKIRTKIK